MINRAHQPKISALHRFACVLLLSSVLLLSACQMVRDERVFTQVELDDFVFRLTVPSLNYEIGTDGFEIEGTLTYTGEQTEYTVLTNAQTIPLQVYKDGVHINNIFFTYQQLIHRLIPGEELKVQYTLPTDLIQEAGDYEIIAVFNLYFDENEDRDSIEEKLSLYITAG